VAILELEGNHLLQSRLPLSAPRREISAGFGRVYFSAGIMSSKQFFLSSETESESIPFLILRQNFH
jgi:hypothetical protein